MHNWRGQIGVFFIRLAICLVILGSLYGLIFGFGNHKILKPRSDQQKLASLRTALDAVYISSQGLTQFKGSNSVAADDLAQLGAHFQQSVAELQATYSAAGKQLSRPQQTNTQTILRLSQHASSTYQLAYSSLSHAVQYDPAHDLGQLNPTTDAQKLAGRANAAVIGLRKAADSATPVSTGSTLAVGMAGGSNGVVSTASKQALTASAACFQQLANQVKAASAATIVAQRNECTAAYPALRQVVIQNIITNTISPEYQHAVQQYIPSLLQNIDAILKQR